MSQNITKVSKYKVFKFILSLILSPIVSILIQPFVARDALILIATLFTVLAGFLITMITLLANMPNERGREKSSPSELYSAYILLWVSDTLSGLKILFNTYLTTIVLLIFGLLFRDCFPFIDYVYLTLATICIIYSFSLPSLIIKIHNRRSELLKNAER